MMFVHGGVVDAVDAAPRIVAASTSSAAHMRAVASVMREACGKRGEASQTSSLRAYGPARRGTRTPRDGARALQTRGSAASGGGAARGARVGAWPCAGGAESLCGSRGAARHATRRPPAGNFSRAPQGLISAGEGAEAAMRVRVERCGGSGRSWSVSTARGDRAAGSGARARRTGGQGGRARDGGGRRSGRKRLRESGGLTWSRSKRVRGSPRHAPGLATREQGQAQGRREGKWL